MQKVTFTAFTFPADGYAPSAVGKLDHTFVVSSTTNQVTNPSQANDDWNCWGHGKSSIGQGATQISQGTALPEWARIIYGTDPGHPTGLIEKVEGVCQNACNRLLVLAGVDVSAANGNMYVILLYGKYGFHLGNFTNNIQAAAAQINKQQPGAISDSELQTVLSRIADDPQDELGTLENHFQSALPTTLSAAQKDQILTVYRNFQSNRQAVFDQEWPTSGSMDAGAFQANYAKLLIPSFIQCTNQLKDILGADAFQGIFKQVPEQALPYLFKTQ